MRKAYVPIALLLIAALAVIGCERKITNEVALDASQSSCFTCHTDQEFEFAAAQQEWANSKHGSGDNIDRNRNNRSYYSSCEPCHTNEGFIAEITGEPATGVHFTVISCFSCHEPHTAGTFDLRVEGSYTLLNGEVFDYGKGNLCVRCHHSRQDVREYVADSVTLSSHWGPHHSDQGDVLIGSGGYEYDGYQYGTSPHTGVLKNGCIDCHMTGSFANKLGGHTWKVYDEDLNKQLLTGCNVDACHGITGPLSSFNRTADEDFDGDGETEGVQDEVQGLLNDLALALVDAGLLEGDAEHGYHPVSGRMVINADSSGALYNYEIIAEERSLGIHNTIYAVDLLRSAINFISTGDPKGVAPRRTKEEIAANR
jgi:hypothetical protein